MKAIILAAGEGKRMQPLTFDKPKPLVKVQKKPLIEHIFNILPDEITEVVMVVGYKGDMIKDFMGNDFQGRKMTFVEQKQPLGTANALMLCKKYVEKESKFLLMYADDLHSKSSIQELIKLDFGLLLSPVKNPEIFGVAVLGENGVILDIEEKPEKPKTNLVATGVYVLGPKIFDYYRKDKEGVKEYYLTEMIRECLKDFECRGVKSNFWIPIGYPEDIEKAENILSHSSS